MKNRAIIIGIAAVIVVALGLAFGYKGLKKEPAKKALPKQEAVKKEAAAVKAPVKSQVPAAKKEPLKRTFTKDMGGLTVKMIDSKSKNMAVKVRAFRVSDSRSSIYMTSFVSNTMQELLPGAYDIELNTTPQKIYKNITINKERETVEDLGCVTGSLNVKALNSKKREGRYAVKVFYPNSSVVVAAGVCGKPFEMLGGTYDVEIGTMPLQIKKNVAVEKGKEGVIDLGMIVGELIVKAVDENGKEVKCGARVINPESNQAVVSLVTNRPIEIVGGAYVVEVMPKAGSVKKDVKINAGEMTTLEFTIVAPPQAGVVKR